MDIIRGRKQIYRILEKNEISRNSGSYKDYERAKRLIFRDKSVDSDIYDQLIKWLTEYLNV